MTDKPPSIHENRSDHENRSEMAEMPKGNYVVFQVDRRYYALPLDRVERVVRMAALTPVPESRHWVSGLLNLHGTILPVINLRKRLALSERAIHPDDRILILQTRDGRLGAIAETVEGVVSVSPEKWRHTEGRLEHSRFVQGVISKDQHVCLVLNADAVGDRSEMHLEPADEPREMP